MKKKIMIGLIMLFLIVSGLYYWSEFTYHPKTHYCLVDCLSYFEDVCDSDIYNPKCDVNDKYYAYNCIAGGNYKPEWEEYKCLEPRLKIFSDTKRTPYKTATLKFEFRSV